MDSTIKRLTAGIKTPLYRGFQMKQNQRLSFINYIATEKRHRKNYNSQFPKSSIFYLQTKTYTYVHNTTHTFKRIKVVTNLQIQ